MFSCVSLESRIPADHPLRPMREMVDTALKRLSRVFSGLCADSGRRSISPERLLRALVPQVLYSIGSEPQLMEQLELVTPAASAASVTRQPGSRSRWTGSRREPGVSFALR